MKSGALCVAAIVLLFGILVFGGNSEARTITGTEVWSALRQPPCNYRNPQHRQQRIPHDRKRFDSSIEP